jgi:hypothetical protein
MMLGNQECDAETAYYLKHGTKPEYKYNCTASPPDCNWEKAYEPDPYYCWHGTRIPQWFE